MPRVLSSCPASYPYPGRVGRQEASSRLGAQAKRTGAHRSSTKGQIVEDIWLSATLCAQGRGHICQAGIVLDCCAGREAATSPGWWWRKGGREIIRPQGEGWTGQMFVSDKEARPRIIQVTNPRVGGASARRSFVRGVRAALPPPRPPDAHPRIGLSYATMAPVKQLFAARRALKLYRKRRFNSGCQPIPKKSRPRAKQSSLYRREATNHSRDGVNKKHVGGPSEKMAAR